MKVVPLYPHSSSDRPGMSSGVRIVTALDVGSSKISCMIAEVRGVRRSSGSAVPAVRITGFGVQAARGIRSGVVVNVEEAEKAVRLAMDAAERMAGVTVEDVHMNISGGRPRCTTLHAEIRVEGGGPVAAHHVSRVVAQATAAFSEPAREVVHVTPSSFHLDGGPAVLLAEGMYADRLGVRVNAISVDRGPLRNLETMIERCMLRPAGFVIAPYAAARAVLTDDERELGVVVVEVGAASTSVAIFAEGRLEHASMLPVGSEHITRDIAAGLGTPLAEAERLKTLHGSVLPGVHDDLEGLSVPLLGEEGPGAMQHLPRSMLGGIIRPRVEEILELVRDELTGCAAAKAIRRVVLTGGGSQLVGMREMAEHVLERTARIGSPRIIAGMPKAMQTPAFAVVAGLLRDAIEPDGQSFRLPSANGAGPRMTASGGGYLSRVREWLGQSF